MSQRDTAVKVWDFLSGAETDLNLTIVEDAGDVVMTLVGGNLRTTMTSTGIAGTGAIHLNGNGVDIDDLLYVEALMRFDSFDDVLDVRVGVADGYNADPDLIATSAWFKLEGTGASNAHTIALETDDGTLDKVSTTASQLVFNEWMKFRIDFATGIQTVSPPGSSSGGRGSVQFYCGAASNDKWYQKYTPATQHMDMSSSGADAAVLGPMFHFRQLVSAPTANVVIDLRRVEMGYRLR